MDFDTAAVDEELGWHAFGAGKLGEDLLPNTALSPAPEPVVERLLRPIGVLRAVARRPPLFNAWIIPPKIHRILKASDCPAFYQPKSQSPRATNCATRFDQKRENVCFLGFLRSSRKMVGDPLSQTNLLILSGNSSADLILKD